jgi:radical SAM-linked protein
MSEGFHPKPRISFPSALALGMEGLDEIVEMELTEPCTADKLEAQLQSFAVGGLSFTSVVVLPAGAKKAQIQSTEYRLRIPEDRGLQTAERIARLLADPSDPDPRDETPRPSDAIESLALVDGIVHMRLRTSRQRIAGPRDVLAALGLDDLERRGEVLTRTRVDIAS